MAVLCGKSDLRICYLSLAIDHVLVLLLPALQM